MKTNCQIPIAFLVCFLSACSKGGTESSDLDLVGAPVESPAASGKTSNRKGEKENSGFVVDLVHDLVFRNKRDGWTLLTDEAHVNVNKLRNGGVDFLFSAIPASPGERAYQSLLSDIALNRKLVDETNGALQIATSFSQAFKLRAENVITVMLLLEGGDGLVDRPEAIGKLKMEGLGVIGLVSGHGNGLADSAKNPRTEGGLTEKGVAFLRVCRDHGIVVDLTHLSRRAFWDVLKEQTGTVIASHVAAKALRDHPRNLDDLQILGLSRYGGVMGLVFNPELLKPSREGDVGIGDVVAHVMHVKALGALNALALGTDFGGIRPPKGLSDISQLSSFRKALVNQGLSGAEIEAIFGDNAIKLLEEVERNTGVQKLTRDEVLVPLSTECDGILGEYEGKLSSVCDGYILDKGPLLEQGTRQKVRIVEVTGTPVKLEIFGQPDTPWQVEGQDLLGKVLFTRTVPLDGKGGAVVSLPQNRGLVRLFFSPTRAAGLREIVIWGW